MKKVLACIALASICTLAQAKGPTGFGGVSIGMSKADVLALNGDVRLKDGLVPYKYTNGETPKEGREKFDAALITPVSANPVELVLLFEGDKLTWFVARIKSDGLFTKFLTQVTEKYGAGVEKNEMKEEQCIYRNGSSFKINSGSITTKWVEELSTTEHVVTTFDVYNFDTCPSNLRYGSTGGMKFSSMSFSLIDPTKAVKPKNLF